MALRHAYTSFYAPLHLTESLATVSSPPPFVAIRDVCLDVKNCTHLLGDPSALFPPPSTGFPTISSNF